MKTSPTRRRPAKRRATLRLPTAAAFAALPLERRTALFARWLARQPKGKTYVYSDTQNCVLAQFAKAIARKHSCPLFTGGGWSVRLKGVPDRVQVIDPGDQADALSQPGVHSKTFGAASRAFQAALKGAS